MKGLKFLILIFWGLLSFFILTPKIVLAVGEICRDGPAVWQTCRPCPAGERCVKTAGGTYQCQAGKQACFDCDSWSGAISGCVSECAEGLTCKAGLFAGLLPIGYACMPNTGSVTCGSCDPWFGEPCKSKGEVCKRVSFGHYECSKEYSIRKLCNNMSEACVTCMEESGTWTALGCIDTGNTNNFIKWVLNTIIPIASGIAFLVMVSGVFQIMTSSGDPKKLQAGKEVLTSAIVGLLMVILSLFLLRLIGVDILHIPGF